MSQEQIDWDREREALLREFRPEQTFLDQIAVLSVKEQVIAIRLARAALTKHASTEEKPKH